MSDPDPGTHYPSASQSRSGQFVSIFGIERLLGVLLRHIIDLDRDTYDKDNTTISFTDMVDRADKPKHKRGPQQKRQLLDQSRNTTLASSGVFGIGSAWLPGIHVHRVQAKPNRRYVLCSWDRLPAFLRGVSGSLVSLQRKGNPSS